MLHLSRAARGRCPAGSPLRGALAVALLFAALAAARVEADVVVGEFTWDDGSLQGWTEDLDWISINNPGSGGVGDTGFLEIDFAATAALPPQEWFALVRAPAASLFAGNWNQSMWVEFDFWAQDVAPQYVQVRWQSATNDSVWRSTVFDSDLSGMSTQTWTHLRATPLDSYADLDFGSGSQEQFVNDLAGIDWIGAYITGDGGLDYNYGMDNFRLMTPEPGEWLVLLAVAVPVLLVARVRKSPAPAA